MKLKNNTATTLSNAGFFFISISLLTACAELKDTGKTIGHGVRDVTTTIGHATRDTVKSIGKNTKQIIDNTTEGSKK